MIKRIIYLIVVIAIVYTALTVVTNKLPDINAQWSVVLSAIALIALPNIKAIKKRKSTSQYLYDYKLFVDRYSHVKVLLDIITKKGKAVVNVHGISGIGITQLLQFTADIINKRIPFVTRFKYWKSPYTVFKHNYFAVYINVSKIIDIQSINNIVYCFLFFKEKKETNIDERDLLHYIHAKYKRKNLVFFLDGIASKEQMRIIDEFVTNYFSIRPNDTFIVGSHKKNISYYLTYQHLEIQKLCKEELMILAKVYNVSLNPNESIELYELSDGIPLYAYLLLRYYKNEKGLCKNSLTTYLREEIIPRLAEKEYIILSYLSLLSLCENKISIKQLRIFYDDIKFEEIESLHLMGLIQVDGSGKQFTSYKLVADEFLMYAYTQRQDICNTVCDYFMDKNDIPSALRYILFLKKTSQKHEKFFTENINAYLKKKKTALLNLILMPAIDLNLPIQENIPNIYKLYSYAASTMLLSCGEYLKAKQFLESLKIDGLIIKRIDQELNDDDFNLYFIYADAEHLLNHYDLAIDLVDLLISNSIQYNAKDRLPQLYWMKAHCLRHQWKKPDESLGTYILCNETSVLFNNTEYLIRSIHGQICISLILASNNFDFEYAFKQLDSIYSQNIASNYDQYRYNTLKYKAIYERLHNQQEKAFELLNNSLNGFILIKRRNIYDLYFEFGEYYRFNGCIADSYDYYEKSVEFAEDNGDYNLESLSKLGIILLELQNNSRTLKEIKNDLLAIKNKTAKNDLYLNNKYANYILDKVANGDVEHLSHFCMFNP